MSVEPGFGGQSYLSSATKRIATLRKKLDIIERETGKKILLEVDGGINAGTAKEAIAAGVDILVAGSYVFRAKDRRKAILSLIQ